MHKKILVAAVSVTLLSLAACSGNGTASTTDNGSTYSTPSAMDNTANGATASAGDMMNAGENASVSVGIGMPSSDGSMASVGEPNEGTSADASTDSMGMGQ